MCGVAGIWRKAPAEVGQELLTMLEALQHRGPDSTGIALFSSPETHCWKTWLHLKGESGNGFDEKLAGLKTALAEIGGNIRSSDRFENCIRLQVEYDGRPEDVTGSFDVENGMDLFSIGRSLEIIKWVGTARKLANSPRTWERTGTHGIGHVRLATESHVEVSHAHPFSAHGYPDLAIVHNGQITNYYKLRRRLEAKGFRFFTDNDSELIAVYLSERLGDGEALNDVLHQAQADFDGTYTFLAATEESLGFARDPLGAKPLLLLECEDLVAMATEEIALQGILEGETLNTIEPLPGTVRVWSK